MTSEVIGLLIMALCIVLFVTRVFSAAFTGVLSCFLMVLFGVCSFEEAFSGFSNSIVVLLISAMVVGAAMFQTGAAQILGRLIIHASHGKESTFLLVGCIVSGVLAMFLANTAILATLIPIVESVCRISPHMKRRNLLLPMALAIMLGGACTLIGCTPQLTANALLSKMAGEEMTMWSLTGPALCIFIAYLVYLFVYGRHNAHRIWGEQEERQLEGVMPEGDDFIHASVERRKLIVMFGIMAFMIIFYVTEILPTAMTALMAALLCVVTRCVSVERLAKELDWETIIFLGSCMGFGNALTIAGSADLIGQSVAALLGDATSPWLIFGVLVFLSLFISQFVTNSTAIIIILPIALSLCQTYGYNVMAFNIGITLGASVACCTPLAASQIAMTQVAGYQFVDYWKFGWKPTLLFYLGILVFVPLFYPLS